MNDYSKALEFFVENGIVLEDYQMTQLDYIFEGANIELIKTFNKAKKEYNEYADKANKALKELDYKTAKQYVEKMKDSVSEIEQEFNNIDSSEASSKFFGFIVSLLINLLTSIIPSIGAFIGSTGSAKAIGTINRKLSDKAHNKAFTQYAKYNKDKIVNGVAGGYDRATKKVGYVGDVMNKASKGFGKVADKADKFNNSAFNVKVPTISKKGIKSKQKGVSKGGLVVAGAVETLNTIRKTINDWKQMKNNSVNNPNAEGNLLRAKIQSMFDELKKQIATLERYIDLNSSIKPYDET